MLLLMVPNPSKKSFWILYRLIDLAATCCLYAAFVNAVVNEQAADAERAVSTSVSLVVDRSTLFSDHHHHHHQWPARPLTIIILFSSSSLFLVSITIITVVLDNVPDSC